MDKMEKNVGSAEYNCNESMVEKQISRDPNGRMDIGIVKKELPMVQNSSQEMNQPKSQLLMYKDNGVKQQNANILA